MHINGPHYFIQANERCLTTILLKFLSLFILSRSNVNLKKKINRSKILEVLVSALCVNIKVQQ